MIQKTNNWFFTDLEQTTSTNDAIAEFLSRVQAPCILSAKTQTNGRGRLGRTWQAGNGNLYVSFAYPILPSHISHFALLSGLAVAQTLKSFAPNMTFQIKWPNDVLVQNQKIAGILFEKAFDNYWIMGIGINITETPALTNAPYQAASLKDLDIKAERLDVLKKLVMEFDTLQDLYESQGFTKIKNWWLDNAYNRGKKIAIKQNNKTFSGIFQTIDDAGCLLLETDSGIQKFLAGDVFEIRTDHE